MKSRTSFKTATQFLTITKKIWSITKYMVYLYHTQSAKSFYAEATFRGHWSNWDKLMRIHKGANAWMISRKGCFSEWRVTVNLCHAIHLCPCCTWRQSWPWMTRYFRSWNSFFIPGATAILWPHVIARHRLSIAFNPAQKLVWEKHADCTLLTVFHEVVSVVPINLSIACSLMETW